MDQDRTMRDQPEKSVNFNGSINETIKEMYEIQKLRGYTFNQLARQVDLDILSFRSLLNPEKKSRKRVIEKLHQFVSNEKKAKCEAQHLVMKHLNLDFEELSNLITEIIHFNAAISDIASTLRTNGTTYNLDVIFYLNELIAI